MNILELVPRMGLGGAERMAASLALAMQARGHLVHLVCLRHFEEDAPITREEFQAAGVRVLDMKKSDGFSLPALRFLAAYCRRHGIQVIHAHTHQVSHYAAGAAVLARVPAVANTIHGIAALEMQWWAKLLFRASCALHHRVVGVCEEVGDAVRRRFLMPARKLSVIPNGIDASPYLALPRRRPNGRYVFGTAGRLDPVKDQRSLIEAFAAVRRDHPECRLRIVGSGELEADLRGRAAALGVAEAVEIRGFEPNIARFLAQIDCFVLSSLSEGLPMALLEAMAAGVPVVATRVGAVGGIVERARCGWLCPPGNSTALAAALREALAAPDPAAYGARGRAAVLERHTVDAMADSYLKLFGTLVRARAGVQSVQVSEGAAIR